MKEVHDGRAYSRKSRSSAPIPLVLVANCATTSCINAGHFWNRVDGEAGDDACWPWLGQRNQKGYGQYRIPGKGRRVAHRVAYELAVGPIPAGLTIDHTCFNKRCCNPRHLEPVTHAENIRRANVHYASGAAKTHCPSGHPYDVGNTIFAFGRRYCRACHNAHSRASRALKAVPS